MKLAVCADIHDNEAYLQLFLDWCIKEGAEAILCCGDVTSLSTLKIMAAARIPIHLIAGNAELYEKEDLNKINHIHYHGRSAIIELAEKKIGLCHEPRYINALLRQAPDIIFHGHTHKPWIEEREKTLIVNPGTLGGVFTPSTFALWDTGKPAPELIRSDTLIKRK